MLRFTKRADYGLIAMHYIASHRDEGAVSAKRIAEEFHIPAELLAKILQRLAKHRLITSHNGPKGGYELTRRPDQKIQANISRMLDTMTLAELTSDSFVPVAALASTT